MTGIELQDFECPVCWGHTYVVTVDKEGNSKNEPCFLCEDGTITPERMLDYLCFKLGKKLAEDNE